MKYSVIIPCFNSGDLLMKTIQSVLDQTLPPLEIVCVDDDSEDSTWETIQRLERDTGGIVRGFQHRDYPRCVRDLAIEHARGDWMALLDHDDLWLPRKMERQAKLADRSKFLCSALYEQIDEDEATRRFIDRVRLFECNDPFKVLFHRMVVVPCTVTLHRSVFETCGTFTEDPMKRWSADFEMWLRVVDHGFDPAWDTEGLAVRRIHAGNMSSNVVKGLTAHVKTLADYRETNPAAVKRAGGKVAARRAVHWRRLAIADALVEKGDLEGASEQIRIVRREAKFDPMMRRLWGKGLGENLLCEPMRRDLARIVKEMRRWCIGLLDEPPTEAAAQG